MLLQEWVVKSGMLDVTSTVLLTGNSLKHELSASADIHISADIYRQFAGPPCI